MALDPRYIALFNLQQELLDKTTGLPLAGGKVYFWEDNNRNNPKSVFQLTGAPPNYTYTALPNPITLTNAGTFSDGANNDVVAYAFPYDGAGAPDNYYIQVFSAADPYPTGTPILTREAVPGVTASSGPGAVGPQSIENALSNPQFVETYFNPTNGINIAYTAGTTLADIAPGWTLKIVASNAGTTVVTRTSVAGSSKFVTNPPYYLTVTPGPNINSLILYQRLNNNPDIWSIPNPNPNNVGWIAAGIALAPGTQATGIWYAPSTGVATQLANPSNASGNWNYFTSTVQLLPGANTDTSDNGFVDIQIVLATNGPTSLSSVQIVGLDSDQLNIPYEQETVNRQIDHTFHSAQPKLNYKPIPSYLVGWDFPLNPAQINGDTIGTFVGTNVGQYFWDQTIVFQTAASNVSGARAANGGLALTSHGAGQIALIQYLGETEARKILSDRASVNINASTTHAGGLAGNITLWACTDANLPHLPTTAITALSATGIPTMGNGTWTQIPNLYQNTAFTLHTASATNSESADIQLNGWDMQGAIPTNTAHFFAIVIGFAAWVNTDVITLNSISLCPGDIPTRPAPKTISATLLDCQRYFYSTFPLKTAPVQAFGINTGYIEWQTPVTTGGPGRNALYSNYFPTVMRTTPTVTLFNPINANAQVNDLGIGDCSGSTTAANLTGKVLSITALPPAGAVNVGDLMIVHATASALLGVVD